MAQTEVILSNINSFIYLLSGLCIPLVSIVLVRIYQYKSFRALKKEIP